MESSHTYFGHLRKMIGDPAAIDQEKKWLDELIVQIGTSIKSRLTPKTVPGLLWHLALKEIQRVMPLVGIPLSDFAGHARYLRALCAAVPFSSVQPAEAPNTDELFASCERLWTALFHREMLDDLKLTEESAETRQRFQMAAMTSLLNAVQGDLTYIEQVEDRVRRLFSPFSKDIIEPALGLTTDEVIRGFRRVRSVIEDRWNRAIGLSSSLVERWREYGRRYDAGASGDELDGIGRAPETEKAATAFATSIDIFNNILSFTPLDLAAELGERSTAFLTAFSFKPGEVNEATLSPMDDDEVRRRPFAKIGDGAYVLLDVYYCSYAPPRRLLECFDTERKLQRLHKRRDDSLEDEAARLFESGVKPDRVVRTYFIPTGADGALAERDLLMVKGSCLFLVESKARALRPVKGRNDKLTLIAGDVKRTIQEGYNQACDVIRYLRSAGGPVPLFDSDEPNRRPVAEIDGTTITTILPVVFLDSYYGLVATELKPWLAVDEAIGFPWVVDRNTFESIILKLDSFERLREFLLWRETLHGRAFNEDEAVFAGFYVRHGAADLPVDADVVTLNAEYADIFEAEYFRRRGLDVEMPPEAVGPPVWSSMRREGDEVVFEIDGKREGSINLFTGNTPAVRPGTTRVSPPQAHASRERVGRNEPCPCGSGKKFKRCCLRG